MSVKLIDFQGRNRQILWHRLGFVHFWQPFGWSLHYRGWSVSAAPVGLKRPTLAGLSLPFESLPWLKFLAKRIQSMYSYSEPSVKRMRTSKVDQENKIYPRVRFHHMHICMHTHTHASPSLELVCPVALKGVGWGLSGVVKPEGKWRSATPPMGMVVRQVLVTWEPSGWFSFISHRKKPRLSPANFTDSPIRHNGHFVGLHAPFTCGQLADVLSSDFEWTEQF